MSERSGPRRLGLVVVTLVVLAAAVVAASSARDDGRDARVRDGQRAVGGLGLGTGIDLSRCAHGFDPRLSGACSSRHEPVPGGEAFCPLHRGLLPAP